MIQEDNKQNCNNSLLYKGKPELFKTDLNFKILQHSNEIPNILGCNTLIGKRLSSILYEECFNEIENSLKTESHICIEIILPSSKIVRIVAYKNEKEILFIVSDITHFKNTEEQLKILSAAVDQMSDWIIITDANGIVTFANEETERITGYLLTEIIGSYPSLWKSGKYDKSFYENLWDIILSGASYKDVFTNKRKNGDYFYSDQTITPIKNSEGKITNYISTGRDITASKLTEERLTHMAYHDVLTGLPNRTLFHTRIEEIIDKGKALKVGHAIVILNVNKFSRINETFGTEIGDFVLRNIAGRFLEIIPQNSILSRVGGDKFGIFCENISTPHDAASIAEKMFSVISQPFEINEQSLVLTASAGISVCPIDGQNAADLISKAESALVTAKSQGENKCVYYTADMSINATAFLFMRNNLIHALEKKEFVIHYQPYFEARTKTLCGMEALLRWKSEEFGIVPPGKFIPILEETGIITQVGIDIVKMVCEQIIDWRNKGYPLVPVSINLSPIQFRDESLIEVLYAIISSYDLDFKLFTFEITESTFMEDIEFTKAALEKMRSVGFSLSIDDFGTGYSSLSYLRKFPLDNLKIDLSFVREINQNKDNNAIVSAIISMAHSLNLKTIAEGVETEEQLEILKELNCDYIQGWLWGRSESADIFEEKFFNAKD